MNTTQGLRFATVWSNTIDVINAHDGRKSLVARIIRRPIRRHLRWQDGRGAFFSAKTLFYEEAEDFLEQSRHLLCRIGAAVAYLNSVTTRVADKFSC
jgi:hypothetical protein